MFNFFKKKNKEEEKQQSQASAAQSAEAKKPEPKKDDASIEGRLEKEFDSLPWFVKRQMKDPKVKERFIQIAKRMEKDGVDLKNTKQVKKWVKDHEKELQQENGVEKVETVVKTDADRIGRNDPCPCGSGKKYKKCCAKE